MARNLFTGDFETGDASQFTSSSGLVQNSVVSTGTWAGDNEDNENFRKTLTGIVPKEFTVYGDFRWDTALGNLWYVIVLVDNWNQDSAQIRTLSNGKLRILLPDTTTYDTTNTFTTNTWYTIRLDYKYSTKGYARLYVNGTLEAQCSQVNTTGGINQDGLTAVKWQGNNLAGAHTFVDNCKIEIVDPFIRSYRMQGFQ